MAPIDYLRAVGRVLRDLRGLGFHPVLVGGMALVVLGSRRVTRDFDFVIETPGDRLDALVASLYGHGLELASNLNQAGDVVRTIATQRVAAIRLKLDAPSSVHFFNPKTGLRLDLLFDFPIPTATLAAGAKRIKVRAQRFDIASDADLLRLKEIARTSRAAPGDTEDIAFLTARTS